MIEARSIRSADPARVVSLGLATTLLASATLANPAGGGGDLDLSAPVVLVVQTIQTGSTPLVAGKSTMLRVPVVSTGTAPPGTSVDAFVRVFVDGQEWAGSPLYSDNGPIAPLNGVNPENLDASLNFVLLPPESDDVSFEVHLNPPGPQQVPETDFSNNVSSTQSYAFACRGNPEIVYVPIDYRPSGGPVPNLPDANLIDPGVGDNFVQGIYPTSWWEYHRSDAPSKLWTSSLSGTGSGLNNSLAADLQLMVPKPDFIYGWVPGGLPYNGQAQGIPGLAGMGNTQEIRHQRTFAHELGHLLGKSHNFTVVNEVGIDVEHQLNLTEGLPIVKAPSLSDIMRAGLLTNQAWIAQGNYSSFFNHVAFACDQASEAVLDQDTLMVSGLWDRSSGSFEFTDALIFEGGAPTPSLAKDESDVLLRAFDGDQLLAEVGVRIDGCTDTAPADEHAACAHGESCTEHDHAAGGGADSAAGAQPIGGFVVVFDPAVDPESIDRVVVLDPRSGDVLGVLEQSPNAPELAITTPKSEATVGAVVELTWEASDADGDELVYYVRYSFDGARVTPLATAIAETSLEIDLATLPALVPGAGYVEVIATDGLNSTAARSERLSGGAFQGGGGNAPWVHVSTPDSGKSFPKGATVVLRSSGWDLEDRSLTGGSIQWFSDLDGPIASGRLTSVSGLSVGTHVLTVQATDSGGLVSSDTTTITITDRALPDTGVLICQADVGSGGPGSSVLTACGGDLSTGTTYDLELTGAAPGQVLLLTFGTASNPTPFAAGELVTIPFAAFAFDVLDGTGSWSATGLDGGGGPFSLFAQALYVDVALPESIGISNAVRIDYLP